MVRVQGLGFKVQDVTCIYTYIYIYKLYKCIYIYTHMYEP